MREDEVGALFDAAADGFVIWSPLLWEPIGEATATAAALRPGERVLDACCGTGAAALPAARAVGAQGHVDAVDIADGLLGRARHLGADLPQLHVHLADVTAWTAKPYDALLCQFGVFFLPDMDAGSAHLVGLVRPGGRAVVTTWLAGSTDLLVAPMGRAAAAEHARAGTTMPQSLRARAASRRVETPEGLAGWLAALGLSDVAVTETRTAVPLTPELAWSFATGAGPRVLLTGLDDAALARVRERYLRELADVAVFDAVALVGTGRR